MATNSKQLFFQELKDEYDAQFELSNALEGKSGQLITVGGIFIPLVFGFSSLLVNRTNIDPNLVLSLQILMVITLSFAVSSIYFSTLAIRIQFYRHSFLPHSFFAEDGELNQREIKEFAERDAEEFYDEMIGEYLESNKYNLERNYEKARKIVIAEWLFLIALAIVPVLVAISFLFT